MSWTTPTTSLDPHDEYDQATADLEQLRERVAAGMADPAGLAPAEYRLAQASKALTRAVTSAPCARCGRPSPDPVCWACARTHDERTQSDDHARQ